MKPSITRAVWEKARAGEYLNTTDIAKLIRAALSSSFPGVKFRVTSEKYAGGSSVNIRWEDGPTTRQVDAIAEQYRSKSFDGSIDMAHTATLWLAPDGSASVAEDRGTKGSGGHAPEYIGDPHHPDAVMVQRMAHPYVHTCRDVTAPFVVEIIRALCSRHGCNPDSVDAEAVAAAYLKGSWNGTSVPWMEPDRDQYGRGSWTRWIGEGVSRTAHDRVFLTPID